ncbi:hypothetical protein D6D25_07150, partial [Aureobasidium pullulans]
RITQRGHQNLITNHLLHHHHNLLKASIAFYQPTMAPSFFKKLKTVVRDLVTKMKSALTGSSGMHFRSTLTIAHYLCTYADDSSRRSSTASPATQLKQDEKERARLPSTAPAKVRMALDD